MDKAMMYCAQGFRSIEVKTRSSKIFKGSKEDLHSMQANNVV